MDELDDQVPTGFRELTDLQREYLGDGDQAGQAADEQTEPGDLMPAPLPDEPGDDYHAEQETARRILAMRDTDEQAFGRRFLT